MPSGLCAVWLGDCARSMFWYSLLNGLVCVYMCLCMWVCVYHVWYEWCVGGVWVYMCGMCCMCVLVYVCLCGVWFEWYVGDVVCL